MLLKVLKHFQFAHVAWAFYLTFSVFWLNLDDGCLYHTQLSSMYSAFKILLELYPVSTESRMGLLHLFSCRENPDPLTVNFKLIKKWRLWKPIFHGLYYFEITNYCCFMAYCAVKMYSSSLYIEVTNIDLWNTNLSILKIWHHVLPSFYVKLLKK